MSYIDETMRQIKKLRDDAVNVAVCETGGGIDFMEAERKLDAFIREKILESYRNGQHQCPRCNPKPSARKDGRAH